MTVHRRVAVPAVAVLGVVSIARAAGDLDDLAKKFHDGVAVLASDAMEGRGVGTKGLAKSGEWIEKRLEQMGLDPAFGRSYRQAFPIKTGVMLGDGNTLAGVADADWMPLGFSSSGSFSGEIAFVGYGIDAPAIGYRELEGVDLQGKVALMLRYEPQERDEGSPFDGKKPSRYSSMRYRVHTAKDRGAVAVVFATGPLQDEGQDKLPAFKNDGPESP
ncbi:MAG: PA domain-containing protein, partial [Acidobacteriota bacterium]